jgi:hypothetical protein
MLFLLYFKHKLASILRIILEESAKFKDFVKYFSIDVNVFL